MNKFVLKNKGIMLLEVLLSLALGSLILIILLEFLYTTIIWINSLEEYENTYLETEYTLDYIINEISNADFIVDIDTYPEINLKNEGNIGIFIVNDIGDEKYNNYNFILFKILINEGKKIIRRDVYRGKPGGRLTLIGGKSNVNYISFKDLKFNILDNKIIKILITDNKGKTSLRTIGINCPFIDSR